MGRRKRLLANSLAARVYGFGRGSSFTPKDFRDLATDESVRQTLRRLTAEGVIRRLRRGVYEYPKKSVILKSAAPPDPAALAHTIARSQGWSIIPTGDVALNMFGLSTQIPARWEYYGDGPTKTYSWLHGTIVFKHRTAKEGAKLSPRTAMVVQALKALGKAHVDNEVIATLRKALTRKEIQRAAAESRLVSGWIYQAIKRIAADGETSHA